MKIRNTSNAPGYVRKFQRAMVASVIATFLGACAGGTGEEAGNGATTGTTPDIGAATGATVDTDTDSIVIGSGTDVEVTPDTDSTGVDSVVDVSEGIQTDSAVDVEAEPTIDTVVTPDTDQLVNSSEIDVEVTPGTDSTSVDSIVDVSEGVQTDIEVDSTTDIADIPEVDSADSIPDNALGLIQSHPKLGLFATAIQSSGLVSYLADPEQQVTVFALSDKAFESLSSIQRDALFIDETRLNTLVRATTIHDTRITESVAGVVGNMQALANNMLIFEHAGDLITVAGEVCCSIPSEAVEVTDTLLNDNAAIHIIDDFVNIDATFFPPDPGSIMDRLLTDEASTISDRIRYTRWYRELGNSESEWTVFVPLYSVNSYDIEPYIVAGSVNYSIIGEAGTFKSVDGSSHVIEYVDGALTIDDIDISEINALQVNNGHVHRIAWPIGTNASDYSSVFETVFTSADHTYLTMLINRTNLADILDDPYRDYTLFAPNDAAFSAYNDAVAAGLATTDDDTDDLTALGDFTEAQVSRILLNHVVSGSVETLEDGTVLSTLAAADTPALVAQTLTASIDAVGNTSVTAIGGEPVLVLATLIGTEADAVEQDIVHSVGAILVPSDLTDNVPDINLPALALLNVRVLSNVNSINTGGTDVANITALVTDANNNALAATGVTFRSTGGVLQNISSFTDENGEASATLKLPQDFQNQDIVVTVSANSYEAAVKVTALGSTLEVTGPETLMLGDKAELVLSLVAGNGEPIANQPVTVTSAAGNTIEPATAVTDPDGRVSILVGSENSNDTVRITALNGTVNATHKFEVAADILKFAESARDAELPVSQVNAITVAWSSEGSNVAGRELRFSTTAGEIVGDATVLTDADGVATVNLRSSSAGPAKITVEGAADGQPKISVDVEFVATVPGKVAIDATSTRVHTTDSSTLMALVTDANGNPVKNQVVDFTSVDLKGGQLNPASAKSNSSGVASVAFTAGDNATQVNDIQIQAKVKGTSLIDVLNLTVVKRVLNVTIGTSNEINIKPLGVQFALPFIVQVADGSGTPLEDATVKLSIRPLTYSKGGMVLVNEGGFEYAPDIENWSAHHWSVAAAHIVCVTEDGNGNRILDTGEDRNGNGSLDPQDPAALAGIDSSEYALISGDSVSTDKNGSGFFEMLYPASNSVWAYVEITARAEALGAEAEDFFRTTLPLPSAEITEVSESPANQYSPYGTVLDCTNTD